jgi:hypothetical protein
MKLSDGGHEAVRLGGVLLEFVLVQLWLRSNSRALRNMDIETYAGSMRATLVPGAGVQDMAPWRRAQLQAPATEIRGVLGDTFEMDLIDSRWIAAEAGADAYPEQRR